MRPKITRRHKTSTAVPENSNDSRQSLLAAISRDWHEAFAEIFKAYYADLVIFAYSIIPEKNVCEDIVQSVFLRLWENRHSIDIHTSIKAYFIKSVRNMCVDEIRHRKIASQYIAEIDDELWGLNPDDYLLFSELRARYAKAMRKLPAEEREIIIMRRDNGMKLADMAQRLNVTIRTIENRLNKAMKHLKAMLEE